VEMALFILLPLGVLLHELGHAVAVRLAGGRVTGFGYVLFLGWVEYDGVVSASAAFWIALSGNLVSLTLGLVLLAVGLFAPLRRPMSALLLAGGGLLSVTTLVFYPLLDAASGLDGDWTQLYSAPWPYPLWLGVSHGALVLVGIGLWRNRWVRLRVSERIGLPWRLDAGERRARLWRQLADAAEQVGQQEGPLAVRCQVIDGSPWIELQWERAGRPRVLRARIGERPDIVEAEALAGEPPALRARWRAVVPEEVLFLEASALIPLLERLRAAVDAVGARGD
ncbi:MAG: hypothetical protein NZL87_01450, partial [Thermomicrobium sp.]|nr:hypothetical protein [Thermomicrobium sp.]